MRAIQLKIDGQVYEQWTSAEVSRDLKNFAGTFRFTCRDSFRAQATFLYASSIPPVFQLRPGAEVEITVEGELVLKGFIETVSPSIDENEASVTISGKDKAGDLIDCAASEKGGDFKNSKLEDVAKKIAGPYGLSVRAEVDTGEIFSRYGLDMVETGLAALEKGARQRQLLLLSDGVGGLVITRSGAQRAPAALKLPGNVKSSSGTFTHKGRYSKTIVRGQGEKAGGKRLDGKAAPLGAGKTVKPENRKPGDGSATKLESAGVCAIGEAVDDEVKRYRPRVHLAATKSDTAACKAEADWRNRSSRGAGEEMRYVVAGFKANGSLWKVNQMVYVSDAYQVLERDMLICGTSMREDDSGQTTEITIISPEAFDNKEVGGRRNNKKSKGKTGATGALDGTAKPLGD
ncbi:MAG: Mu P family protein [Candidatus Tokpelaia sp.]|nr:MAG: Mu P family protein [Candidatus Tokpelaia sp.]KAA6205715.1 MAG: Mu P family protein [Candidatus Tokpelaia sp.]